MLLSTVLSLSKGWIENHRFYQPKYLFPIAMIGANIGKNTAKNEIIHWSIAFVGRNLKNIPVALVYIPKRPNTKQAILPKIERRVFGKSLIIFLPRFFILSQTVRGS